MNTLNITTAQNIDLEYELASVGERITGYIIDWLIIIAYYILTFATVGFSALSRLYSGFGWLVLVITIPPFFYDVLCESLLNGQSLGKKAMGIRVISLSGEQPTFGQYLIRWVFRFIDFTLLSGLTALLSVLITQKKQRLGDLVAGTTLVKTNSGTGLAQTIYEPTENNGYQVTYPEVINLKDSDIQLIKEVLSNLRQTGNTVLALQAQHKIEQRLHIMSRFPDSETFLHVIIADYNYVTSRL